MKTQYPHCKAMFKADDQPASKKVKCSKEIAAGVVGFVVGGILAFIGVLMFIIYISGFHDWFYSRVPGLEGEADILGRAAYAGVFLGGGLCLMVRSMLSGLGLCRVVLTLVGGALAGLSIGQMITGLYFFGVPEEALLLLRVYLILIAMGAVLVVCGFRPKGNKWSRKKSARPSGNSES